MLALRKAQTPGIQIADPHAVEIVRALQPPAEPAAQRLVFRRDAVCRCKGVDLFVVRRVGRDGGLDTRHFRRADAEARDPGQHVGGAPAVLLVAIVVDAADVVIAAGDQKQLRFPLRKALLLRLTDERA